MTIIYTPDQQAAAQAVITAELRLRDSLYEEPVNDQAWDEWIPLYDAAFQAYEDAASVFRRAVGTDDLNPHSVVAVAPRNPFQLITDIDTTTVRTEDGHFLAGPSFHSGDTEPWAVDLYDPPLPGRDARRVVTIEVDGREQAQAMVDLMSWALGAGARVADQDAA